MADIINAQWQEENIVEEHQNHVERILQQIDFLKDLQDQYWRL